MAKFCTGCGSELKKGATKCLYCGRLIKGGYAVDEDVKTVETPSYEEKKESSYTRSYQTNTSTKDLKEINRSRTLAFVLAIFFGTFGAHNFYLGNYGKAVTQMLLTLLSGFFLAFFVNIWSFVEAILIITGKINVDGYGKPLVK